MTEEQQKILQAASGDKARLKEALWKIIKEEMVKNLIEQEEEAFDHYLLTGELRAKD